MRSATVSFRMPADTAATVSRLLKGSSVTGVTDFCRPVFAWTLARQRGPLGRLRRNGPVNLYGSKPYSRRLAAALAAGIKEMAEHRGLTVSEWCARAVSQWTEDWAAWHSRLKGWGQLTTNYGGFLERRGYQVVGKHQNGVYRWKTIGPGLED